MMTAIVYLTIAQTEAQPSPQTEAQLRLDRICQALGIGDLLPNSSIAASDLIFNLRTIANCDTEPQLRLDTICLDVENNVWDLTLPGLASDVGIRLLGLANCFG